MSDDVFDKAAGDIFDKAAGASGPNLKTGEGMETQAQQQAHTALSGAGAEGKYNAKGQKISGPNGEPLTPIEKEPDTKTNLAIAMNRASSSPTPFTSASAVYSPAATAKAIIGGKIGGSIGSHFGPYGQVVGGILGGGFAAGIGESPLTPKVNQSTGAAELSTWGDILSHPTKIPETVLKRFVANRPIGPSNLSMAEREALELNAQKLIRRGTQQGVLDNRAAVAARIAARNAPQQSPFEGMTSTAGGAPPVAAAQTMPQGNPTPFVSKFASPEPSRIVSPDSPPPSMKVTYQSYPRSALYQMAKQGDIEAGLELVRNPKGFSLPPNFKFLIEESAKKMPWRNLSK